MLQFDGITAELGVLSCLTIGKKPLQYMEKRPNDLMRIVEQITLKHLFHSQHFLVSYFHVAIQFNSLFQPILQAIS